MIFRIALYPARPLRKNTQDRINAPGSLGGIIAALIYVVITALIFRNLLPVFTTDLFGDLGDPLLNTSILAWNATHVPLTREWWNFPAFAPLSGVTAFTEHMLGAYPLASPVIWVTGNPVLACNLLLLGSFPLNGVATFALVRELTGSRIGAFVGGLAFAFAPFASFHVTHVQLLLAFGMPIALLGLHRFLKDGKQTDLTVFGIGWMVVALSNAYMLVFFPILLAFWAAWFFTAVDSRKWLAIASVGLVATLPVVPLLVGYHERQVAYGFVRGVDEIKALSATLASIGGISHRAVLWKNWLPGDYGETALFPGFAIAALALIGVVMAAPRRVVLFYFLAAIAMWLLALGPERGPYWLLLQVPGAQSIRVPARAWQPATLGLAVCAGFGAAWLGGRRRVAWLVVPLALMIVAEGWFEAATVTAPTAVALDVPLGAMVLDLPISAGYGNADAQHRAILGGYRVVNGFSGYFPAHFGPLREAIAAHRPEAFAPFRQHADLYVVVRPDVERPFVEWLETQRGIERLRDSGAWKLFRLPRDGDGPAPPPLLPLPTPGTPPLAIP